MMVCVHAAVGAMLGAGVKRPGTAFVGGIASHLLCDLLPHKDYDMKIEAPLEAAHFVYLIKRYGINSPQFWGAAGAVIPDAENALAIFGLLKEEQKIFPTHAETSPWFLGHGPKLESPVTQAILAVIALAVAEKS